MTNQQYGPWPDEATARSFLAFLLDGAILRDDSAPDTVVEWTAVAHWLIEQGIGPLAYQRCREIQPLLASHLQADMFASVAQSALYREHLAQIEAAFQGAGIPLVLLKGAALARSAYADAALRTMSDIDIWAPEMNMPRAVELMTGLGFWAYGGKESRPLALQALSHGEIQFYGPQYGMIELHWSPFPGWWLTRAADVDDTAVWNRIEPFTPHGKSYQLAAEDMVIQVAVHLTVTHQMGMTAVRGLMDIAMIVKSRPVDWEIVAERAQAWRVGTAVWLVLSLTERLLGLSGLEPALKRLRPSPLRQKLIRQFASPAAILAGEDLRNGRSRYLFLLLLVDRLRDMAYLIFRTVWPEKAWLQARYQGRQKRRHHLWQIIRYGRV